MREVKKFLAVSGLVSAAVALGWLVRNRRLFTVSDVTTGESPEYPGLRAHVYFATPTEALAAATEAIESLPRWRLIVRDPAHSALHAEVESLIGGFIGDVTIVIVPLGDRHARAIVRSHSRLDVGDLGENARNIRLLQSAMDSRLIGG